MFDYVRLQALRARTLLAYRGNWRNIPIQECGEPLVQIPQEMVYPYYARDMKLVTDERLFARSGLYSRFLMARQEVQQHGYDLIAYDAWRSLELQENLFWHYMREFTAPKFGMKAEFARLTNYASIREYFESLTEETQELMRNANRTYVSWPSSDPKAPSPHASGGSIDVWLYKDGKPTDLGVPFDWMEENAGAFYQLKLWRNRFAQDSSVCEHRKRLLLAMSNAGFTCYGPEIWHFNFGNQMDALVKGGPAIYSYIEP